MDFPQTRGRPQDPVIAFELIQPILNNGSHESRFSADDAGGAGRSFQSGGHIPVLRQRSVAVEAGLLEILAEEYDDRNSRAAADRQQRLHVGVRISIQVANVESRGGRRKVLEDRTLVDAVAAPDTRQHQHLDVPLEVRQQLSLGIRQFDAAMKSRPPLLLVWGSKFLEEIVVLQAFREFGGVIHERLSLSIFADER